MLLQIYHRIRTTATESRQFIEKQCSECYNKHGSCLERTTKEAEKETKNGGE